MSSSENRTRTADQPVSPANENPLAHARRLVHEKRFEEAIQFCRAELQNGHPSAESHEILGRALLISGDPEGALWHFLQLTLLLPDHAAGYVNLGAAYNQLGKHPQAVEVLSKGMAISPTAAGYYHLGLAHQHLKNLSSAKTALREALRYNANIAEAHEALGRVHAESSDFSLAITHFQKALELRPKFEKAIQGLNQATRALSQPRCTIEEPDVNKAASAIEVAPRVSKASVQTIDPTRARFLSRDIGRAANDLRQHFENTIIPLLVKMRRFVIEGRSGSIAFRDQLREYRVACQYNTGLRKTLRSLMVRLFATEELTRVHGQVRSDESPPGR